MRITPCKNCYTRYRGKFCPSCGQRAKTGRLRWRTLWDNLAYSITNMDRGFLFTIKELFTRPGAMMRDYLAGKRANYYRPFSLLIILAAVYALFASIPEPQILQKKNPIVLTEGYAEKNPKEIDPSESVSSFLGFMGEMADDVVQDTDMPPIMKILYEKVFLNPVTYSILLLFGIALLTPLVFRRNGARKYNVVEYIFIGAYMTSQRFLVDLVLLPYRHLFPGAAGLLNPEFLMITAYIGLIAWDFKVFFRSRWRSAIPKTLILLFFAYILTFFIGLVLFVVTIVLVFLIGIAFERKF